MLSGISIMCFAASYSVSFILEATRFFFRSNIRTAGAIGFSAAGIVAHTIYLTAQARNEMVIGIPLSSWFDWCLLAALFLAVTFFVVAIKHPGVAVGLFLLPLVLVLIGTAYFFRDLPAFSPDKATRFWGTCHGLALLLGTVTVVIGFVAGTMYLIQAYRLKHKLSPLRGLELPSLEWLQRVNVLCLVISSGLLVLGLLAGIILNLIKHARDVQHTPWTDSVIWGSTILLLWLISAMLFNRFYKPARQGKKVAYLTMASFLFVVLAISMALFAEHASPSAKNKGQSTKVSMRLPPAPVGHHTHGFLPSHFGQTVLG